MLVIVVLLHTTQLSLARISLDLTRSRRLFMGGFFSVAIAFYMFAPKFLAGTEVCCGPGTEKEHVLISLGLGLFAGGVALWVLKIGIFLGGSCLGLVVSFGLRTVLAHFDVFQTDESFAMFYFGAAIVGGLLALYKDKPIIIFLTSFGGAFAFFIGVGYFGEKTLVVLRVSLINTARLSAHTFFWVAHISIGVSVRC